MTEAKDRLKEFLANDEPDSIDIPFAMFKDDSFEDRHELKGMVQLAVLESKITSSILRDGGGYRLKRIVKAPLHSNRAGNVAGYTAQPDAKVALVNEFKADEERLLRKLDWLAAQHPMDANKADQRWLAIARTHFQEGFMALNRAVFQPQRIRLPEDDAKPPVELDPILNAERN